MSDFSYLSNIIGETRREFITVDVLRHLDEGGTLPEEQRDRAETLNNYASNAMEGLVSGLEGLGSMMFHAALHDRDGLERIDAANTAWLVSLLGDLIRGTRLLESDTKHVLHKSEANAIKAGASASAPEPDATDEPAKDPEERERLFLTTYPDVLLYPEDVELLDTIKAAAVRGGVNQDLRETILSALGSRPKEDETATA